MSDQKALCLKLESAARACQLGVPRVHLLDGHVNEALLAELFSSEGIGTMVHSNEYQHIRRALKKDVRRIMSLIRQSVQNEELIHRTRQDILSRLEDYWVLEIDRNLVRLHRAASVPRERQGGTGVPVREQDTARTAATGAS